MNPKCNIPDTDQVPVKAMSDVFIAMLLSAPKNERILRGLINAVLTNSGHVAIKEATVLNPFNIREFAINKQIVLDVRVRDELNQSDSRPVACVGRSVVGLAALVDVFGFWRIEGGKRNVSIGRT